MISEQLCVDQTLLSHISGNFECQHDMNALCPVEEAEAGTFKVYLKKLFLSVYFSIIFWMCQLVHLGRMKFFPDNLAF